MLKNPTRSFSFWADGQPQRENTPLEYICPLTRKIFVDPVMLLGDEVIYERAAILAHLGKTGGVSPKTHQKLSLDEQLLISMPIIKTAIEIFNKNETVLPVSHHTWH